MSSNKNTKPKDTKSIRLDDVHRKVIKGLIPFYGSTEGEVIRNIVVMWINGNLGSPTMEKLKKFNAINWNKKEKE